MWLITSISLADVHADPPPEAIKGWLEVALWIAGGCYGVTRLWKEWRPDPSADEKFATKREVERVDRESCERDEGHRKELERVERETEKKHAENVRRLEVVGDKLDRNWEEMQKDRDKIIEKVRHDVRGELSPIQGKIDDRAEDAEVQFRKLAGDIGGLQAKADTAAQTLVRMQQTLETLLSRNPVQRGGGQS